MDRDFSGAVAFRKKWTSRVKQFLSQKKPFWIGPLLGGLAGIIGGVAGVLVGMLLGLLLQKLLEQIDTDKALLTYFESPGPVHFSEPEPGLAAFCALGVIVLFESSHAARKYQMLDFETLPFRDPIVQSAILNFKIGHDDIPAVESYCRLAASRFMLLNSDLLTESLVARRSKKGDLAEIGVSLEKMAFGEGLAEARYIRSRLDPAYQIPQPAVSSPGINPWLILGLEPTASTHEIKSTYRKLATQFHPDHLQFLDKQRQTDAEKAFMKIKEAYREALKERSSPAG